MTPREIVLRAIEFRDPPRVPVNYCNRDLDASDTRGFGYGPAAGFVPPETEMTEWGYVWHRLDDTMGQTHTHPLVDDDSLTGYVSPDPKAPGRFDGLPEALAACPDQFRKFSLGITGFNQATFLRGFEHLLMDLHLEPARAERIIDLVFDFELAIIERGAALPCEAVAFGDDWGTQQGLMIDPAHWRAVFKPRYAAQFARVHAQEKKVWFHTCGNVAAVLGDLIDIGVDVLELLQPDIYGVEWLAREFGGTVCFCCAVDHQRRAITDTRDEIFAYAQRLRDQLGAFHGGFIGYVEDYASLGMDEAHYQWIREAFHCL